VERAVWRSGLISNVAALAMGITILLIVSPRPSRYSFGAFLWSDVAVVSALLVVAIPHGIGRSRRLLHRSTRWLIEDRHPSPEEVTDSLNLAWRQAVITFPYWVVGMVLLGIVSLFFYPPGINLVRLGIGAVVLAASATVLNVLTIERALGPVLAQLPPSVRAHEPRTGMFSRILASWAVGAAGPLAVVAVSPEKAGLTALQWLLLAMGFAMSLTLVYFTARSFSEPLGAVRRALRRIQAGDLSVSVSADSLGEIGQLQVAFNQMAEGLRERERLQEVFGRHVGTEVAREALRRGGTLGGDVSDASALFVDLIDSTALAQRLDPPDVVAVLNRFFDVVVRVVATHQGWVNKFHGDGALCVFGVPEVPGDHRIMALDAALALRREISALATDVPGLDAGIGVSSGLVVAGNMGSEARYEFTVIGDPVNEAARLADHAKLRPGRVVASAASVWLSGNRQSQWAEAGHVKLRGRASSTTVFEPA
jgi:adenylate cyclase